jgi:NAD(P)-dependent dehydrogenase (short-subunit alcohol dehydrogenase family)
MDLKLKGKMALVTGTGSQIGFGKAIALTLAKEGCDIASADIDLEGARKTAAEIEKLGRKSLAVKVDVSKRDSVDKMVETVIKEFGRIDILVNNAGTSSVVQPFMQMTKADWDIDIGVTWPKINTGASSTARAGRGYLVSPSTERLRGASTSSLMPWLWRWRPWA